MLFTCVFGFPRVVTGQDSVQVGDGVTCTQGVVSAIELDRRPVFDPRSTRLGVLQWTYRALNLLHVRTAPSFIRRELLFEEGDCFDPFLVGESERLLDSYGFMTQVSITHEDDGSGGQRVAVATQDEWSTQVDVGVTYDGGPNLEKFAVTETNFLGQGIFAEFSHRERREIKSRAFGLATPRFFGRSDASVTWSQARSGHVLEQYVRYPFVGETGRVSLRQGYLHSTDFFTYSADGTGGFTHTLVPAHREVMEFSAARRYGEPGGLMLVGISLTRDVVKFPTAPEVALDHDFDDLKPFLGLPPTLLTDQLRAAASTRVAVHLGTRRLRYVQYQGLDGISDRMLVSLGVFAGVTLGRGFAILTPRGVPGVDDFFGRVHGSFGAAVGSSLLHGSVTVESRHDDGGWQDVLGDTDLVAYLRNDGVRSHTVFVRASLAGGWNTGLPFQLRLGGREGVRSLAEDRFPGGRMARFVVEDRVAFPWPRSGQIDLGLTAFGDVGRVWPGDAPFALDSGWQAALGIGLRIGFPGGTRNIWRTDVAFPVGRTEGSPIFRVTFEFNRMRDGFFSDDVNRSRRFTMGPDYF